MAIKNILLHLTDDKRADARIKSALALAAAHEAHLTALYTIPPIEIPPFVMGSIPTEIIDQRREEHEAAARKQHADFVAACEKQGVVSEWRIAEGDAADILAIHARYADLTVIGQPDPDEGGPLGYETLPHELVLTAGAPVLVVPYAGRFNKLGQRILIAWNGSRESARAVRDALPLLARARKVTVFSVNPTKRDHIPGADIAAQIALHVAKVEVAHTVARDIDVGDVLLAAVTDRSADLVVMGAYGHSRLREIVLGGATQSLLGQMTVPVLLSH